MNTLMFTKAASMRITFTALRAYMRVQLDLFMSLLMTAKISNLTKQFCTPTTFVRLRSGVRTFVSSKVADVGETFSTFFAVIRHLSGMQTFMPLEVPGCSEGLSAMRTFVGLLTRVNALVFAHIVCCGEWFLADGAFERSGTLVDGANMHL